MTMVHICNNQTYEVKQTGNRFYYFSRKCLRWMPVAKSKVTFLTNEAPAAIQ